MAAADRFKAYRHRSYGLLPPIVPSWSCLLCMVKLAFVISMEPRIVVSFSLRLSPMVAPPFSGWASSELRVRVVRQVGRHKQLMEY